MTGTNLTSRLAEAIRSRRYPELNSNDPGRLQPHVELSPSGLPRYAFDRLAVRARDAVRGRQPWLTADSLELLDQLLLPTDHGLEYGAGGTTIWFASRVEHLDSVEGKEQWYGPLRQQLDERRVGNVGLHLIPIETMGQDTHEHREAYINVRPDLGPSSLDFVLVDGEYRDDCALRAVELLKPGGLLILDNATTYLPASTRSPWKVDRPATSAWEKFVDQVATWRCVWTTNGVWDTAVWFKP
jgi:predicted O-methyltransferase YrrM